MVVIDPLRFNRDGFTIVWDTDNQNDPYEIYYIKFTVYETFNMNDDDIFYNRKNASITPDPVYTLEEAEIYLEGSMKWDGCSNIDFFPEDSRKGYKHFCGAASLKMHCDLLQYLYDKSFELMNRVNERDNWVC